ncbi:uncharacterized protein LOC113157238 [Anabas testudineus]|uniref:Ig-like domain-containing protein n=1 Tax=Anabas testudineus TaxID=64144 RepID=A0A3Q1JAH6_ANATE|nr:uncharacterized protein LOC113157238 [Anabas testudineus]
MASPNFVFYLVILFLGKMAHMADLSSSLHQQSGFVSAHAGDSVTLRCFYDNNVVARYYWYKQTLRQKPRLISTYYVYDENGTFYDEYKNDPRFKLDTKNGQNHLIITGLHLSDSATYFCASSYAYTFDFGEETTVSVKGSGVNIQPLVYQSTSETIQPGGSVTLNCTVHTGSCDGEHSVYWFKDSDDSPPRIIYTHGDRNDQCERKPGTQTHSCIYNLPMKSLNVSHARSHYCAVASCGHLLFGNGTKVELMHKGNTRGLAYFLSGTLAFTTTLTVSLFVCIFSKRNSCQCTEIDATYSATNVEGYQYVDNLHYSTIKGNKANRSRRQREDTEVMYR